MTSQKKHVREVETEMLELVSEKFRKETSDLDQLFSDTKEWILFLTASNSNSAKRFPMTPSDVRTRKRIKVETIVESVEEDEVMPLPECLPTEPILPVRRGSRTASKLASMKMKEPSLNIKLRRPTSSILKADLTNTTISDAPPTKRARQGKSKMAKADLSAVTAETSFASARDSLASSHNKGEKYEPMETDDEVVLEKVQSTKIFVRDNSTEKSSLRVKTVTVTGSSKRVTKKLTTTVVESPIRSKATSKAPSRQHSLDMFSDAPATDSDDDVPIIHLVKSKPSKPMKFEPMLTTEQVTDKVSIAGCGKENKNFHNANIRPSFVKLSRFDAEPLQNCGSPDIMTELLVPRAKITTEVTAMEVVQKGHKEDRPGFTSVTCDNERKEVEKEIDIAEDASFLVSPIAPEPANRKLKDSKPNALGDATNRNTPESIRNMMNRNFEPVSVKKRIEALEHDRIFEPAVPLKPDVPVRMTRTKVKAMMASLCAVKSVPEKTAVQKMDTAHLMKIARKSVTRAKQISLAKERSKVDLLQQSLEKENSSPPGNATKYCSSQIIRSTTNKNRATTPARTNPSRLVAQASTSKHPLNTSPRNPAKHCLLPSGQSTTSKNKTTPHSYVHPSRLLKEMSISKQPLVNLNGNISTFLPKTKMPSAADEAEEKRKEERRLRRENKDDAVLKKKALIDDKIEHTKKKREEKMRNVLAQKALKEREKAEFLMRVEKENEEKARLAQEREENLKKEILRKKEEAKQKAAKIEERRVRKEAERLQALKLQEEEQQRLQAQKKKEQEDADRLHAKRLLEEKDRKEKEAAMKEAAMKLEKQKQAKHIVQPKAHDSTFVVDKPILIPSSQYDYPLLDLSKGNDSDFSEGEEDIIPKWANRDELLKSLKVSSAIPIKAILSYFGSKPTTPDLNQIFPNGKSMRVRSSSAHWRTPPRCSMLPNIP